MFLTIDTATEFDRNS